MSQAVSIDHVGIVGRDLDTLAALFERLGFTLTPLARHASGRTGNRCVMLHGSYLELIATMPGETSATLDRFLARHEGIHIVAFGVEDAVAAQSRLRSAGLDVPVPDITERAVHSADLDSVLARFELVSPPDVPEGRVLLIRHQTPDVLWQPEFMEHPNKASALAEVLVTCHAPAESAARLSRLAGRPVVPDPAGGYVLDLPRGCVRIATGGADGPSPRFAALTIATEDGNAALATRLADAGLQYQIGTDAMTVRIGGASLRFIGLPSVDPD